MPESVDPFVWEMKLGGRGGGEEEVDVGRPIVTGGG